MSSSASGVHVLATGKLAATLPPACCGARARAPFLLCARVCDMRPEAQLVQLQWRCRSAASRSHSRWFDADDVSPVTRASELPPDCESGGRAALWRAADVRGRFLVATRRLAPGERVLKAAAFAVVVGQPLVARRCHWCLAALARKALRCGACEFALYCSRECLDADAPLHDGQCRALAQLRRAEGSAMVSEWRASGVDEETVRLALAVLSMERFVGTTGPLEGLVLNRRGRGEAGGEQHARVLAQVAKFIVAGLADDDEQDQLPLEHVCTTLERVRCNAHPLKLNGATSVGVGIFPDAAMALNHSCMPNVVPSFDRHSRTLAFHAIRDIAEGQAIEYAYIDLFQATARRQDALHDGFGFTCDCWRCVHESEHEDVAQPIASRRALEAEEAAAMNELMQLRGSSADRPQPHVLAEQLFQRHFKAFERTPELLFAYRMLQMQLATARHDWARVVLEAEELERMWLARGLPEVYPTMEVLQLQIQRAADHGGNRGRALKARKRVREIRRLCGYEDDEEMA